MKITVERDFLLKGLSKVSKVVGKVNTLPILANVLLVAKDDHLLVTSTDLEITISTMVEAQIHAPGQITVPAAKLLDIVKELPKETQVSLAVQENDRVAITCGKAKFNLVGLDAKQYPESPTPALSPMQIPCTLVRDLIEKTASSMSADETKHHLNGIFVQVDQGAIKFVATDGHRLSLAEQTFADAPSIFSAGVILPRKGVLELKRLAETTAEEMQLGFSDKNLVAETPDTRIFMRLIDGNFPGYQKILPQDPHIQALVNTEELTKCLRRMSTLSSGRAVKLEFSMDKLVVSATDPDLGNATEELSLDYRSNEEFTVGLNPKYLLDAIQTIETQRVCLAFKGSSFPALVLPETAPTYRTVIMPMRL